VNRKVRAKWRRRWSAPRVCADRGRAACVQRRALPDQGADESPEQRDVDFELWIGDNCSTDGTEEICRDAARKDRAHPVPQT